MSGTYPSNFDATMTMMLPIHGYIQEEEQQQQQGQNFPIEADVRSRSHPTKTSRLTASRPRVLWMTMAMAVATTMATQRWASGAYALLVQAISDAGADENLT
jgi:hypothetical protein